MAEPTPRPWTVDDFFAWQERQPDRYELVGGFPLKMMAGTRNVHDDIVVNLLVSVGNQLRGSPCRPFTGDGSVETLPGQIRRPALESTAGVGTRTGSRRASRGWFSRCCRPGR